MAEFQAVMRHFSRLCKGGNGCAGCPMHVDKCCEENLEDWDAAKAERIIMKWAAANPEPRYPTWREWHHTKAHNDLLEPMKLCNFAPCGHNTECPDGHACLPCYDSPIPADIAKKLGVGPIKEVR